MLSYQNIIICCYDDHVRPVKAEWRSAIFQQSLDLVISKTPGHRHLVNSRLALVLNGFKVLVETCMHAYSEFGQIVKTNSYYLHLR